MVLSTLFVLCRLIVRLGVHIFIGFNDMTEGALLFDHTDGLVDLLKLENGVLLILCQELTFQPVQCAINNFDQLLSVFLE